MNSKLSCGSLVTINNNMVYGIDISKGRDDCIGISISEFKNDGTIDVLLCNSYSSGIGTISPKFLLDISANKAELIEKAVLEENIKIRNNIQIIEDRLNAII
jgi:hypothetical protein